MDPEHDPTAKRATLIRRVGELHSERREELGQIIVREMGKPIEQALGEVDFCQAIYDYYADNAEALLADEPITLLDGEGLGDHPPQPLRSAARNHAVELSRTTRWHAFSGPNLIIGNTILLKHAPQCPESALAIGADVRRRRLPRGRLHQHLRRAPSRSSP